MINKIALQFQLKKLLDPKKTLYGNVLAEHLRLFIEGEKRNRFVVDERPFECYVVDSKSLEKFLSPLCKSNLLINKRFQIIINDNGHYSMLDILWGMNEKKYLLLDAAGNYRKDYLQEILDKFAFEQKFIAGARMVNGKYNNLQNDTFSCSIFSFYHAVQISKIEIYNILGEIVRDPESVKNKTTVYWDELPIQLVWNAQSLTFLNDYFERNKKHFSEAEIMKCEGWIKANIKPDAKGKDRNVFIDNLFNLLVSDAIELVEKTDEKQLRLIGALTHTCPIAAPFIGATAVCPNANLRGASSFFRTVPSLARAESYEHSENNRHKGGRVQRVPNG